VPKAIFVNEGAIMTQRLLLTLLTVAFTGADKPPAKSGIDKAIQGKWKIERAFTETKEGSGKDVDKFTVEITDSTLTINDGKTNHEAAITGEAAKKTIDMVPRDGRFMGQILKGMYTLKGETLSLYFAEPGGSRPSAIPKVGEAGHFLLVLKRKK
jgi:uncharacterized protein (TIGR03067 family)